MLRSLLGIVVGVLFLSSGAPGQSPLAPDGTEVQIDLPSQFHLKNRGGSDGAGLCVWCSLQHAAIWQDVRPFQDVFKWHWKYPGGGWPDRVDKDFAKMCQEQGKPVPDYIQYQGKDISILKLALKTGRMPCVTYAYSPTGRYGGARIAHMVNLVHLDDRWCGILDNNYPGRVEWFDAKQFPGVWTGGRGSGWAVIYLNPGPPPPPHN